MPLCDCSSTTLPKIGAKRCGVDYGQVQTIAFVKIGDLPKIDDTGLNELTEIVKKASWTASLAESAPKVQMSPVLYNPQFTPGDAKTWGGGNATPNGATYYMGADNTTASFELRRCAPEVAKEMKKLTCLAENGLLGVYLFDSNGAVIGTGGTSTLDPIKVLDLFVGDRNLTGLDEPDMNALSMSFDAGWSDNLKAVDLSTWNGVELLEL